MSWGSIGWPTSPESNPTSWPTSSPWRAPTRWSSVGVGIGNDNQKIANGWSGEPQFNTGLIWRSVRTPVDLTWNSICWSDELNLFCAVASSGTGNRIMISSDGKFWRSSVSPADNSWNSVCWAKNLRRFCAVASSGTGNRVMTSDNGVEWVTRTSAANSAWQSVCWSNELRLFVAVGSAASIMTSPDGISWTSRAAPVTTPNNNYQSVCWSSRLGLFAACASGGDATRRVITSPDGINWTLRTTDGLALYAVSASDELRIFLAIDGTGSANATYSIDGATWKRFSPFNYNFYRGVVWSKEIGMFAQSSLGDNNATVISGDIYSSIGITRKGIDVLTDIISECGSGNQFAVPTPGAPQLSSICYSAPLRMFAATAVSGTGNRVFISP